MTNNIKQERRYRRTEALILNGLTTLLQQKSIKEITVRELADLVDINRSTFYLHYENIGDLLAESAEQMINDFLSHIKTDSAEFITRLNTCPIEELYLITPQYLTPYLTYIRDNRRLFLTALENAETLRLNESYEKMMRHIIMPIFERFKVPERDRGYIMAFYIHGIMALISEWLRRDCCDSIDYVSGMIQGLVKKYKGD